MQPINKYFRETSNRRLENILRNATLLCAMLPEDVVKCCLTCDLFKEDNEICLKYSARPPARVIAFGCEFYRNVNEEIPF